MQSAREAAGATGIRRSPRPLLGERFINGSGALRGEVVNVCLDVIASQRVARMRAPLARNDGRGSGLLRVGTGGHALSATRVFSASA